MQSNSGHHHTPLFWYLGFHGNAIWMLSTCQKLPHTTVNIPTIFDERNQNVLKIPPFLISMATAAKFVLQIQIFLAYLVPLDVDVTGNITAKKVSSLPTNFSLQNTHKFSLKSEIIDRMATIANQWLISICNIIIYLEIKFLPNRRIFIFWPPFWIQNGHHSKPTMDINLQHHNLLGSQISSKSEDFYILADIFLSKWPP